MNRRNEKAITLIALVITIVVLLILAGVSISMLTGENGIITQAQDAKENSRGAEIKEKVEMAANENKMVDYTTGTKKGKQDVIDELLTDKKLKDKEVELLETEDVIKIGEIEIDFSILEEADKEVTGGESDITSPLIIGTKDESGEITVTNGKYTLQVGDYINYSPTDGAEATTIKSYDTATGYTTTDGYQEFSSNYTGNWRVLGISEEGQIVIVPENVIKTTLDGYYYLKGQDGYKNAVDELDKISAIFANGYGASGKARSVTVEDINKITGYNPVNTGKYDPEQTGSGTRYGSGELHEYGNKLTYYWKGDEYPYYIYTKLDGTVGIPGSLSSLHSTTFNWFDNNTKTWKSLAKATLEEAVTDGDITKMEEITTLESNYYYYYLDSLTKSSGTGEGLTSGSKTYTTLYNGSGQYYWLGSHCVGTTSDRTIFGVRLVNEGLVGGDYLCFSDSNTRDDNFGVRPAVYLNSNIQLTGNSTDGWTIVKN